MLDMFEQLLHLLVCRKAPSKSSLLGLGGRAGDAHPSAPHRHLVIGHGVGNLLEVGVQPVLIEIQIFHQPQWCFSVSFRLLRSRSPSCRPEKMIQPRENSHRSLPSLSSRDLPAHSFFNDTESALKIKVRTMTILGSVVGSGQEVVAALLTRIRGQINTKVHSCFSFFYFPFCSRYKTSRPPTLPRLSTTAARAPPEFGKCRCSWPKISRSSTNTVSTSS